MLCITKIFRFETAHAIHGYDGPCRNVHGHSYVLHVTVGSGDPGTDYLPGTGFVTDFKDLKKWVGKSIIDRFDHRLYLSDDFLAANPGLVAAENLERWPVEPSAENMLLYIRRELERTVPEGLRLCGLKLYETSDSYVEWTI